MRTARYSERAARVFGLAQDEARRLNHAYVGTEHLLLGLIREGNGIGVKALQHLGVDLDEVRSAVEHTLGQGSAPPGEKIPATPQLQGVMMDLAAEEARALGHSSVGTEHLLLGLMRDRECPAAQVLEAQGADLERVRREAVRLLGSPTSQPPPQV